MRHLIVAIAGVLIGHMSASFLFPIFEDYKTQTRLTKLFTEEIEDIERVLQECNKSYIGYWKLSIACDSIRMDLEIVKDTWNLGTDISQCIDSFKNIEAQLAL